jgi:predicted MFS family arabinose efflux permease
MLPNLIALYKEPAHLKAFLLSAVNMMTGMMVIPFISPVLVNNVGLKPAEITYVYLAGGLATFFTARRIGRWSDRYGAQKVYRAVSLLFILPVLFITHIPVLPLVGVVLFFPFFMVLASGATSRCRR